MSLELREIHKHFGPVRANDGINLTVAEGALHGLLGENGAGKSTLMKVLSGFHSADSGEIVLDGKSIKLASPSDAIAAGIGMLHQDPLVFLPFSVIDNFVLGSPGPTRLDRTAAVRDLNELSDRYGFNLDPTTPARLLTVGERQCFDHPRRVLRADQDKLTEALEISPSLSHGNLVSDPEGFFGTYRDDGGFERRFHHLT